MEDSTSIALAACYPEGLPEQFPVGLFAPTAGQSLHIREAALREKIDALQADLLEYPQDDIKVTSTFAGGVYAREIFIPKGTLLIGKVHLSDHFNICLRGDLTFLTVDGPKRVVGPTMFVAPAGTKKLAYANEDSTWMNVHPALSDDPEQIVDAVTVSTFADYDRLVSRVDMEQKVAAFGFTPQLMHDISVDTSTLDDSPLDGVEVRPSALHGLGLFATRGFVAGEVICPALIGSKRSLAGRYSNHSPNPTAAVEYLDGELVLIAAQDVVAGQELTTDYGHTLARAFAAEEVL